MKVVLASASPRRKELLTHIFPDFDIIPANGEEEAVFHTPSEYVSQLARQKALEVARTEFHAANSPANFNPAACSSDKLTLVIGADTIVYADGKVLGKPSNEDDAFSMLSSLSGKAHKVYTGVSLVFLRNDPDEVTNSPYSMIMEHSFSEETEVYVDTLLPEEINAYIATGDPMDKAGSYGIQGPFSKHITHINGDYFNVVGLPVSRIYRELKSILQKI